MGKSLANCAKVKENNKERVVLISTESRKSRLKVWLISAYLTLPSKRPDKGQLTSRNAALAMEKYSSKWVEFLKFYPMLSFAQNLFSFLEIASSLIKIFNALFRPKNLKFTQRPKAWISSYLGFELEAVVEQAMPFPCWWGVEAAGVGQGIVVIPPSPRLACVVGMPSPPIRWPRLEPLPEALGAG